MPDYVNNVQYSLENKISLIRAFLKSEDLIVVIETINQNHEPDPSILTTVNTAIEQESHGPIRIIDYTNNATVGDSGFIVPGTPTEHTMPEKKIFICFFLETNFITNGRNVRCYKFG